MVFCRKASTRSDLLPQTRMAIVHVYPGDSSEIVRLRAGFEQKDIFMRQTAEMLGIKYGSRALGTN